MIRYKKQMQADEDEPVNALGQLASMMPLIVIVLIALLILLNDLIHITILSSLMPVLLTMDSSTALLFVISGLASFTLLTRSFESGRIRSYGKALCYLVIVIGSMQLFLIKATGTMQQSGLVYQFSLYTSLAFILLSIALMSGKSSNAKVKIFAHYLLVVVLVFSYFIILGFLYRVPEFLKLYKSIPLAPHTSIGIFLLSFVQFLSSPSTGLTVFVFGKTQEARAGRFIVLAVFIIPSFGGFIQLGLLNNLTHSTEMSMAALIGMLILFFLAILIFSAVQIGKKDSGLRASEANFKALLESAPDSIIIASDEGRIEIVNSQTEKIFGYHRTELLGAAIELLIPERFREHHVQNRLSYMQDPGTRPMGMGLKLFGRRKDGTEFPVEISLSPVRHEGRIRVFAAIRDVTRHKEEQEKSLQKDAIFKTLVSAIQDYAVIRLDKDGKVSSWNDGAVQLKGYSAEEIIGRHFKVFYPPNGDQGKQARRLLKKALLTGKAEDEGIRLRKDGSSYWAHTLIAPLRNSNGEHNGFVKVTRDITESKEAHDLLEEFNTRLKSQVKEQTERLEELTGELRVLMAHLYRAREEERRTVAREIHDELGQMMVGLRMDIVWAKNHSSKDNAAVKQRLNDALELLTQTREAMRRISRNLHPALLEDLGLFAAMKAYCVEFANRTSLKMNYKSAIDDEIGRSISSDIGIGIYRIMQESLTNVAKHAAARSVQVQTDLDGGILNLIIADNGRGFDANAPQHQSLGLVSMRERAYMLSGTLDIQSNTKGTSVNLKIPINKYVPYSHHR